MGFKAEILRGEGGEALEQAALGSGAPALEVSGGAVSGSGWVSLGLRLWCERQRGAERCRDKECLLSCPGADKLGGRGDLGGFQAGGREDFFTPCLSPWWKRLAQLYGGLKKK